jgi:hypothetical protein
MERIVIATQEDAALVVSMAERAVEDGALIIGARLTRNEFTAFVEMLDRQEIN